MSDLTKEAMFEMSGFLFRVCFQAFAPVYVFHMFSISQWLVLCYRHAEGSQRPGFGVRMSWSAAFSPPRPCSARASAGFRLRTPGTGGREGAPQEPGSGRLSAAARERRLYPGVRRRHGALSIGRVSGGIREKITWTLEPILFSFRR